MGTHGLQRRENLLQMASAILILVLSPAVVAFTPTPGSFLSISPSTRMVGGKGRWGGAVGRPLFATSKPRSESSDSLSRLASTAMTTDSLTNSGRKAGRSLEQAYIPPPPFSSTTPDLDPLPLPAHPGLKVGRLPNGLTYVILKNAAPEKRFEAHLEILAGSADELEEQQGMAHLVEHIAYMGSRKRESLFGTGSQTNAYTDFHHTVYYASCPVADPFNPPNTQVMLNRALEALAEVLEARFEESRLVKERAAVLSEMSMVNTIEYRVECAILQGLHAENMLSKRFPIGLKPLIDAWTLSDVKKYHDSHYNPSNAILYLVGDVDLAQMESQLTQVMGKVPALKALLGGGPSGGLQAGSVSKAASKLFASMGLKVPPAAEVEVVKPESAKGKDDAAATTAESIGKGLSQPTLKLQSRHFPPILHAWSGGGQQVDGTARIPLEFCIPDQEAKAVSVQEEAGWEQASSKAARDTEFRLAQLCESGNEVGLVGGGSEQAPPSVGVLRVFSHEMISSVSFHLFAKRPVVPVTTFGQFKQSLATRVALAALQVRLNVLSRKEPLFGYVEFNVLDSSREACSVCSLDMMCDADKWQPALQTALGELQRVAKFGLTEDETRRYVQALLADAEQLAAQGDTVASGDQVTNLMETTACGHTFLEPETAYGLTAQALEALTLAEVNAAAYELGAHVLGWEVSGGRKPSALIACAPAGAGLEEDGVRAFFDQVREAEVTPPDLSDLVVPTSLLPHDKLPAGYSNEDGSPLSVDEVEACFDSEVESATPGLGAKDEGSQAHEFGVVLRKLKSGVSLNYRSSPDEPQRACLRLTVAGGRMAESPQHGDGSFAAQTDGEEGTGAGNEGNNEALAAAVKGWAPPQGALALGGRTMQEGGALGGLSRTQVELFCVDQLVMVEIVTEDEFTHFNFAFPTNKVAGEASVSGIEAVFQIVRQLLVPPATEDGAGDPDGFLWEQDALDRAVSGLCQQEESSVASLEGAARQALVSHMTKGDPRFTAVDSGAIKALTLDQARDALCAFLKPQHVEVSVSGDFEETALEELAARYLGSLPSFNPQTDAPPPSSWAPATPSESKAPHPNAPATDNERAAELANANLLQDEGSEGSKLVSSFPVQALLRSPFVPPPGSEEGKSSHLDVAVSDSDPRALCHVSGCSPNKWGLLRDGEDVRTVLGIYPLSPTDAKQAQAFQGRHFGGAQAGAGKAVKSMSDLSDSARRAQPLWPAATLGLVQEVLNRRLFSQVRERKQLTYDANFQMNAHERLSGGWWLVTVTSSPANSEKALEACVETLLQIAPDPSKPFGAAYPLSRENLMAAQRVLVQRHTSELRSNKYWSEILSTTQIDSVAGRQPGNGGAYQREWADTVKAVTLQDIELILKVLDLKRENMYTCVAVSGDGSDAEGGEEGAAAPDNHGHTMPSLGRR